MRKNTSTAMPITAIKACSILMIMKRVIFYIYLGNGAELGMALT
jgi:hypothetical protein